MLIEISHDFIVSTSQIAEIERLPGRAGTSNRERVQVTFADGRTHVANRTMDAMRRQLGTIIPAPPGYRIVYAILDDAQPHFWTEPVIAFRFDGASLGGPLAPITDEGEPSDSSRWALVRPDGAVTDFDRSYANLDEFKSVLSLPAEKREAAE